MIKKIRQLWDRIGDIGVNGSENGRELIKIRLLSQLITITFITSCLALATYLIFFDGWTIVFTTLANLSIEILALIFIWKRKHRLARHIAIFAFSTQIAFNVCVLGGNFGEANIFTGLALGAFILYEGQRSLQIGAIGYVCLLFVGSKLYAIQHFYGNDFTVNPYDELVTFPMVLVVLGLILLIYQIELRKYEAENQQFIKDLEEKNQTLNLLNEELEQFTYIASHDLKSPLRIVSSNLDLIHLHLQRNQPEEVETDLSYAQNATRQMYALVNDILEYKRINLPEKQRGIVSLEPLLEEVHQDLEPLYAQKAPKISWEGNHTILVNRQEWKVLFQNLLENALKYNESTPAIIQVKSQTLKEMLLISVQDNGIGIHPDYHEKIFQFFKRLHPPAQYEGTGIGLGLCKKIVQKYGGEIWVDSEEGNGATFWMKFPSSIFAPMEQG